MKKIFLAMFLVVLLVGVVSADELLTIDNIKQYDESTQTVTIVNTFGLGRDISTIQLNTPLHNMVGAGYQKVAEFEVDLFDDTYSDAFEKMEFYDLNNNEKKFERSFDYKYLTTELFDVEDYKETCRTDINGTQLCSAEVIGTHQEEREVWLDLDTKVLTKGKITIGIFTYVEIGDKIEWIPTLFGKEIDEWASWEQSLNVGLLHYYKLDDETDSVSGGTDMTLQGTPIFNAGLIGNGLDGSPFNTAKYLSSTSDWGIDGGVIAISVWVNSTSPADNSDNGIFSTNSNGNDVTYKLVYGNAGVGIKFVRLRNGVADNKITHAVALPLNESYQHIVAIYDGAVLTLYLNGTLVALGAFSGDGTGTTTSQSWIGRESQASQFFHGKIDEVAIWNRNLTITEITNLYNNGIGITHSDVFTPSVTLVSPLEAFNSSISSITFNGTISEETPVNVSLIIDDVFVDINTSGILADYSFTETLSEGDHTWNYQACNSDGCTNGTARNLSIDTLPPIVDLVFPTNTTFEDGLVTANNVSIDINWSSSDANLDTCWYNNGTTNITITCNDNTTAHFTYGTHTFFVYANDTFGRWASDSVTATWQYRIFLNNQTYYNTTTYETAEESYKSNITYTSSIWDSISANLNYNGTLYSSTITGSGDDLNFTSTTIDIPLLTFPTGTIVPLYWSYSLTNTTDTYILNTSSVNQTVNETVWAYCNSSYTVPFLNVSFKDESNVDFINATIPTSNFIYYLGDGTVTKTYTYVNTTLNYYYDFCASPNLTIHTDPYIQYKSGANYPQRIYDAEVIDYTNDTTDLTLYLLGTADGIYVTFQVINTANLVLSGVEVSAVREIDGSDVQVGIGTTGADGGVTLWLNPDFSHDFTFTKSGFTTLETSFSPTQAAYTITLGGGVTPTESYFKGMIRSILPTDVSLVNDTAYTFGFNLTSSFWSLTEYGFDLRLVNGTIITGGSTSTSGTPLTLSFNTLNQSKIYLDYYWLVNSTYTNGTSLWIVYNTLNTQWSISTFFTDLDTYLDSGFFGIDDFGRYLIIFIVIFFTIGIMSYKFGFTSPLNISVMTFLIVFFFDVVVKLIPPLSLVSGTEVNYLLTFLTGLIATIVIINEVRR